MPYTPDKGVRESFDPFYTGQRCHTHPSYEPKRTEQRAPQQQPRLDPKSFNVAKWLETFQAGEREFDVREVRDVIREFCVHKDGSRLVQDLIGSRRAEQVDLLFSLLQPHLLELANDQSGN